MDRLLPTTSGPTPDAGHTYSAPDPDALEELRAAWDAVTAARDRLFELLSRDGDSYETWRKAMGDEMLAHVAFVELAKEVANRAYGRVSPMGRPEGEQAPKRVSAEGSPAAAVPVIFPRRKASRR